MNIYSIVFFISLILSLVYVFMWHKHFDVHFTLIFSFIPVSTLGFWLLMYCKNESEFIMATKITYIGGCFLPFFILMCLLDRCKIRLKRWIRASLMLVAALLYASILSIGKYGLFYKKVSFEIIDGERIVEKEYGIFHTIFIIVVLAYGLGSLIALLYSYYKKKDVSRSMARLLFIPVVTCIFVFFLGKLIDVRVELAPFGYVFSQIIYLIIVNRLSLYDINAVNADSILENGETGFIAMDFNYHYLGCNDTAKRYIPELAQIRVDASIKKNEYMNTNIVPWIKQFKADNDKDKYTLQRDEKEYLIDIDFLYDGKFKRGYCFNIIDDTKNQQYIKLLNNFNTRLQEEVEEKTQHLEEMHNKLILGMAAMVESRDNSTGGHIRRTSDCVQILVDEITKENKLNLSKEFCEDIIKAAPMHDLGKIAVDDAILRKPGRFEDWEFEKMKIHAAEGARIIHEILKDTDDESFRKLAENVANFHHERWDGSGYPEGLKGEEIPLEARIMAIADVYDALVSKRVYKDSMSFEKANEIIMEGMGKHFDKSLEPYYVAARPKLEEYYRKIG